MTMTRTRIAAAVPSTALPLLLVDCLKFVRFLSYGWHHHRSELYADSMALSEVSSSQ